MTFEKSSSAASIISNGDYQDHSLNVTTNFRDGCQFKNDQSHRTLNESARHSDTELNYAGSTASSTPPQTFLSDSKRNDVDDDDDDGNLETSFLPRTKNLEKGSKTDFAAKLEKNSSDGTDSEDDSRDEKSIVANKNFNEEEKFDFLTRRWIYPRQSPLRKSEQQEEEKAQQIEESSPSSSSSSSSLSRKNENKQYISKSQQRAFFGANEAELSIPVTPLNRFSIHEKVDLLNKEMSYPHVAPLNVDQFPFSTRERERERDEEESTTIDTETTSVKSSDRTPSVALGNDKSTNCEVFSESVNPSSGFPPMIQISSNNTTQSHSQPHRNSPQANHTEREKNIWANLEYDDQKNKKLSHNSEIAVLLPEKGYDINGIDTDTAQPSRNKNSHQNSTRSSRASSLSMPIDIAEEPLFNLNYIGTSSHEWNLPDDLLVVDQDQDDFLSAHDRSHFHGFFHQAPSFPKHNANDGTVIIESLPGFDEEMRRTTNSHHSQNEPTSSNFHESQSKSQLPMNHQSPLVKRKSPYINLQGIDEDDHLFESLTPLRPEKEILTDVQVHDTTLGGYNNVTYSNPKYQLNRSKSEPQSVLNKYAGYFDADEFETTNNNTVSPVAHSRRHSTLKLESSSSKPESKDSSNRGDLSFYPKNIDPYQIQLSNQSTSGPTSVRMPYSLEPHNALNIANSSSKNQMYTELSQPYTVPRKSPKRADDHHHSFNDQFSMKSNSMDNDQTIHAEGNLNDNNFSSKKGKSIRTQSQSRNVKQTRKSPTTKSKTRKQNRKSTSRNSQRAKTKPLSPVSTSPSSFSSPGSSSSIPGYLYPPKLIQDQISQLSNSEQKPNAGFPEQYQRTNHNGNFAIDSYPTDDIPIDEVENQWADHFTTEETDMFLGVLVNDDSIESDSPLSRKDSIENKSITDKSTKTRRKKGLKKVSNGTKTSIVKNSKNTNSSTIESSKKPRSKTASSTYRGVSKCPKDGRWQARIRIGTSVKYLGRFRDEVSAAEKYDEAAREIHGDKAILNFPFARGSKSHSISTSMSTTNSSAASRTREDTLNPKRSHSPKVTPS